MCRGNHFCGFDFCCFVMICLFTCCFGVSRFVFGFVMLVVVVLRVLWLVKFLVDLLWFCWLLLGSDSPVWGLLGVD